MAKRQTAESTSDKRNIVYVPLAPEANRSVNYWCDKTGVTKTQMVRRLIEWFAAAPSSMQHAMLGIVPRDMVEDYVKRSTEFVEEHIRRAAGESAGANGKEALRIPGLMTGDQLDPRQQAASRDAATQARVDEKKKKRGGGE